jgi:hypothetical protein
MIARVCGSVPQVDHPLAGRDPMSQLSRVVSGADRSTRRSCGGGGLGRGCIVTWLRGLRRVRCPGRGVSRGEGAVWAARVAVGPWRFRPVNVSSSQMAGLKRRVVMRAVGWPRFSSVPEEFGESIPVVGSPQGGSKVMVWQLRRAPAEPSGRRSGRPGFWRELGTIVLLYGAYTATRNAVPHERASAVRHGERLLSAERGMHLDLEASLSHLFAHVQWLGWAGNSYYATAHFVVTVSVLAWLWARRPGHYRAWRTEQFSRSAAPNRCDLTSLTSNTTDTTVRQEAGV